MKKIIILALSITAASSSFAQTFYSEGHADIGIGHDGTNWDMHFHDDTGDIEYDPQDVVVVMGTSSISSRPISSSFGFIGVGAGESFFRLRQNQFAGQPYLGVATDEFSGPSVAYNETDTRVPRIYSNTMGRYISLELVNVVAPSGGFFSMYSNDPDGNGPVNWIASSDGISSADRYILPVGGHEHANYAFTVAGDYNVTFRAKYWDGTQFVASPDTTYNFQAVPEPASMVAMGLGLLGLLRKRKSAK